MLISKKSFQPMTINRYFLVENSQSISNEMDSLSLTLESQLYLYIKDPVSGIVKISEVYKLERNAPAIQSFWCSWSEKFGFLDSPPSLWERRNDLKGQVFQMAVVDVNI